VLWSVVEQTALAEPKSNTTTIARTRSGYAFRLRIEPAGARRAAVVIWTTTPGPCRAIARSPSAPISNTPCCGSTPPAKRAAPASENASSSPCADRGSRRRAGIDAHVVEARFPGTALAGTVARHPLDGRATIRRAAARRRFCRRRHRHRPCPHRARHGADDWELASERLPVPDTVGPTGFICRRRCSPGVRCIVPTANRRRRCVGDRGGRGGGRAPGARHPRPLLPAFLALEGRRSSSATRRNGSSAWARTICGRRRWRRSRRQGGSRRRARTASIDDREQARLVRLAPAQLGACDPGFRQ